MAEAAFSQLHSPRSGSPVYTGRAPESRTTKELDLAQFRPKWGRGWAGWISSVLKALGTKKWGMTGMCMAVGIRGNRVSSLYLSAQT